METDTQRALGYKFFSLSFLNPDLERFNKLRSILDDLDDSFPNYNWFRRFLFSLSEKDLSDLRVEYTKLFVNAYPSVLCPPYESYFKHKRLSHPEVVSGLRTFYSLLGYDVTGVASDHISAELEFMYIIILSELPGEEKLKLQVEFLSDHLRHWALDFSMCVEEGSGMDFYRYLGSSLREFITKELNFLGI